MYSNNANLLTKETLIKESAGRRGGTIAWINIHAGSILVDGQRALGIRVVDSSQRILAGLRGSKACLRTISTRFDAVIVFITQQGAV